MGPLVAEYDNEAASYDETRFHNKLGRHLDYMHKRILGDLIGTSKKKILEAGVGTGRFATWLAKNDHDVTGVDISIGMLGKAKIKANMVGIVVNLIQADLHFLPFRENVFDACICINVVDHISNFGAFVREVGHVEKPKGIFVFNVSNMKSPYLPVALMINLKNRAFFRGGRINSRWVTIDEISNSLRENLFRTEKIKGCMIASPLPFGEKLVKVVEILNLSSEDSWLKSYSGSIFIKAYLDR